MQLPTLVLTVVKYAEAALAVCELLWKIYIGPHLEGPGALSEDQDAKITCGTTTANRKGELRTTLRQLYGPPEKRRASGEHHRSRDDTYSRVSPQQGGT